MFVAIQIFYIVLMDDSPSSMRFIIKVSFQLEGYKFSAMNTFDKIEGN